MNERYQEVLAQYEMEVLSVRKGRGSWICETDKGLKLLREYQRKPAGRPVCAESGRCPFKQSRRRD